MLFARECRKNWAERAYAGEEPDIAREALTINQERLFLAKSSYDSRVKVSCSLAFDSFFWLAVSGAEGYKAAAATKDWADGAKDKPEQGRRWCRPKGLQLLWKTWTHRCQLLGQPCQQLAEGSRKRRQVVTAQPVALIAHSFDRQARRWLAGRRT